MNMPDYYIWTIGCQMNKAESQDIADYFECLGFKEIRSAKNADVIVLNTCVVRQSAENKVKGMLGSLQSIKSFNPRATIVVTGCFVNSNISDLQKQYRHVDLFFKPAKSKDFYDWAERTNIGLDKAADYPVSKKLSPTSYVTIMQGCNNFCSYCIVPYRRGREKSISIEEITRKVSTLAQGGVKEVTLLGQNVNSYGHDLPSSTNLSVLLQEIHSIQGIERIRFLTNHPKDMSEELIKTMALLDKICEHINLPIQSGDNTILKAMRRNYTSEQYMDLINTLRRHIPAISISTDIIVGFPGETDDQFERSLDIVKNIGFDAVHTAIYSTRPGTIAARKYSDNISLDIKKGRFSKIEEMQTGIASKINAQLLDKTLEVLVEGDKKGKWFGRTRSDKLVFFESPNNCLGQLINVKIVKTSPWSLYGQI
ncbi:tRNA (N6-isopentenyl adenosine(37)-C2)-methylthiotransferase MiaB [Chloroflexota bacterium]